MYDPEIFEDIEDKDDLTPEAQTVLESLDLEHLIDRLEGRSGGLRPSKPRANGDTGLEQYVWRMARFHSGDDPSMPITASWDLHDYLKNEGIMADEIGERREPYVKEIEGLLDVIARVIVHKFGRNPDAGLQRWEKAIYG